MFSKKDYPGILRDIGLTDEQEHKIEFALEQMMFHALSEATIIGEDFRWGSGVADGIHRAMRFFAGDMKAESEYPRSHDANTPTHDD